METIYIDSLFFINLLADYLLCLCAARICGLYLKRLRYLSAAFLGAAYSVFVFVPGFEFLAAPAMKLCAGISMALIAYAGEEHPFRCAAVFLSVSAAFGGALWAISLAGGLSRGSRISMKVLLSAFTLLYSLGTLIFRCRVKNADRKRVKAELSFMGEKAEFMVLLDTGNSLTDPLNGAEVMVASPHGLRNVLKENTAAFNELDAVELIELFEHVPAFKSKLRLIPYSALGTKGLLPVFRPDKLVIDGKERKDILVALSKSASGDGFDALL